MNDVDDAARRARVTCPDSYVPEHVVLGSPCIFWKPPAELFGGTLMRGKGEPCVHRFLVKV